MMSSPAEPHSCELCESRLILTFGNYYSDQGWYELIDENYFATGEAYVFNIAYDEAVLLADQGCELFEWLVTLRRDDTHSESYLRAYFAHNSREQMVLDWVDELGDHIDGGTLERKLIVCAEKSELAAEEVAYRPPNLFPASKETVETIKSWLQECFTTHAECQQLQNSNRPSDASSPGPRRLLHLSGKAAHPRVRLRENSSTSNFVEYAALSYCWGGDQPVKLKESIVKSWMTDIPYDQFPQTIKDAIQVAMALDLEYLWVDALCIIQDSNPDKAEQISRMAEIYEQAYITISAASATAVPEGFLHDRYMAGEKGFRMPFTCQDGRMSAVILWQGREPDAWEPIDQRSWCLQESILSPRVLEYGTHNIRWHCAQSRADESKLRHDGWIGHSKTFAQLHMSHPLTSSIDWTGLGESYKFVEVWQTLVSHYTRRGLGWYQDKLLAISAIARKMSKMTDKHYAAGLWTEFLGEMLLWHPNHGPDAKEKPSRHATYVAPSWSWASFSGEIDFTFGSTMHLLEIVRCEVKTQIPNDEFSAVTSARLEIKTLMFGARLRKGDYGWFLWDEEMKDEIDGSLMFDVAEAAVDGEVVEDEQVLLALIMTQDALMLKKKKNGVDEYVRIGIFREGQRMTNRARWEMGGVVMVLSITTIGSNNNSKSSKAMEIAPEAREMVCEAENPPPHADGPEPQQFEQVPLQSAPLPFLKNDEIPRISLFTENVSVLEKKHKMRAHQALRLAGRRLQRPLLSPRRRASTILLSSSFSSSSSSSSASATETQTPRPAPSNPALNFPCLDAIESRSARLSADSSSASRAGLSSSSSSSTSSSAGPEPSYTSGDTLNYHCRDPLLLDWGGVLPSFNIAYESWGRLNADKSNAILLHTGLSASSHARSTDANPAPGWWEKFIGPGAPLDTDRFHVVCTNVIGGCYGSTGPGSVDPGNGENYATRFPILTMQDMVRAQFRLLDHLGIGRLYASVGSSMGGMQSLAAATLFPDRVSRVATISGCARSHPYSIAMRHTQRQVLMMDPNWNRGFYYGRVPPHAGMKLAREIATVTYRSGPEWEQRFGRRRADPGKPPALCPDFLIETYLDHAGEKWCLTYDPNSLLYVSKAMDLFDLGYENQVATQARRRAREDALATAPYSPSESACSLTLPNEPYQEQPGSSSASSDASELASPANPASSRPPADLIRGLSPLRDIPTLVMGVASDILFPAWQQREIAESLRLGGNRNVTHVELSEETSLFGHDTFLLDLKNVGGNLRLFLD
ncbi:uncharacterized protein Triagg1_5364 [Trichoderma aggressivum f. europaeum]|uniref:Homoserine O-acetyltransferase n=1 Tax=Trichoderma aggressivum f. europaeum TaxID=173218 RepID=A0AAE1M2X4_9HYPO|nr:hypothetical protein Triagg1_5364 [Trichoderma aggressivum f. europaeum]